MFVPDDLKSFESYSAALKRELKKVDARAGQFAHYKDVDFGQGAKRDIILVGKFKKDVTDLAKRMCGKKPLAKGVCKVDRRDLKIQSATALEIPRIT